MGGPGISNTQNLAINSSNLQTSQVDRSHDYMTIPFYVRFYRGHGREETETKELYSDMDEVKTLLLTPQISSTMSKVTSSKPTSVENLDFETTVIDSRINEKNLKSSRKM